MGTTGKVGSVALSLAYIVQFTNAVELYQKRNYNCFRCGRPDHLLKDCPKTSWKVPFLNPDPFTHWSGPANIAQVKIDDDGLHEELGQHLLKVGL